MERQAVVYERDGRECLKLMFGCTDRTFEEARDCLLASIRIINRLRESWPWNAYLEGTPNVDFSTRESLERSFCEAQEMLAEQCVKKPPTSGCGPDGDYFTLLTNDGSAGFDFSEVADERGELVWAVSGLVYMVDPSIVMEELAVAGVCCEIEMEPDGHWA